MSVVTAARGGGRGEGEGARSRFQQAAPLKTVRSQTAPPKFMPEFSSCLILLAKNFGISEMQHVSVTHSLYLQLTYILTAPINYINPTIYKPTKMRTIHGKIPQIHQRVQLLPLQLFPLLVVYRSKYSLKLDIPPQAIPVKNNKYSKNLNKMQRQRMPAVLGSHNQHSKGLFTSRWGTTDR